MLSDLTISLDTLASWVDVPQLTGRNACAKVRQNRRRVYRLRQLYPDDLCSYCSAPIESIKRGFTVEHVEPRGSQRLRNSFENLVPACSNCNHKKGDKTLLLFLLDRQIRLDGHRREGRPCAS